MGVILSQAGCFVLGAAAVLLVLNLLAHRQMKSKKKGSAEKKRFHLEKSTVLAILCLALGGGSIVAYWVALFRGLYPDASVAVKSLEIVVGGLLSYCLYQFGLKNSRNKYGVDADGNPYKQKLTGDDDSTGVG